MPWRWFVRVSAALQMASLLVVLGTFFLTPPIKEVLKSHSPLVAWLPSYWFTGLLHLLRGDLTPELAAAGRLALRNLTLAAAIAAAAFSFSWMRGMRIIVETADVASGSGHTIAGRMGAALLKLVCRRPLDRAILLFIARTAVRSRQHRLLLAAHLGIGFAVAVTFLKSLFLVSKRDQSAIALLATGILFVVCAIRALRAAVVLPHVLPANWILRLTAVHKPASYFQVVRRSLILFAALPAWSLCTVAYLIYLPVRDALEASLLLAVASVGVADWSLDQFRKFPFACSWLPASGQSLATVRALAYGLGFLLSASAVAAIELWALRDGRRFAVLIVLLAAVAAALWRRNREFAASAAYFVQFEDRPPAEIFALDLHPDGQWSSEQAWADAVSSGAPCRASGVR
jgi:hypothetical protein